MEKWTLINKNTNEPIKVSNIVLDGDCGEIFFFTDSDDASYWFVDTEEDAKLALEEYVSYILNSIKRPYFDNLDSNNYLVKKVSILIC